MSASQEERAGQLLAKVSNLADRLEKGRAAIQEAVDADTDRADYYFERWLGLLTDYEQTVDELRRMEVPEDRIQAAGRGSGT